MVSGVSKGDDSPDALPSDGSVRFTALMNWPPGPLGGRVFLGGSLTTGTLKVSNSFCMTIEGYAIIKCVVCLSCDMYVPKRL
jgi:hypothetical protein